MTMMFRFLAGFAMVMLVPSPALTTPARVAEMVQNTSNWGRDKAQSMCRSEGGRAEARAQAHLRNMMNFDASVKAKGLPASSPQAQDMKHAQRISDAVPRRKE